jgi:hypothetical protein
VPKAIYTYFKTVTIIIKINTMAHQMLNTLAGPHVLGEPATPTHGVLTHPGYGGSMQPETLEPPNKVHGTLSQRTVSPTLSTT